MKEWVLVLMIYSTGYGAISMAVSPHKFDNEAACKSFVSELRAQHSSKRIDASCINISSVTGNKVGE